MTDHYSALGLRGSASLADIKKAFRQLAATYHPDRNSDPEAPARFRAVQQAYDDNRRRNLLDDPLQTASDIWNPYLDKVLQQASPTP